MDPHCDRDRTQLCVLRCLRYPPWYRHHGIHSQRSFFHAGRFGKDRCRIHSSCSLTHFTLSTQILTGAQIPLSQLRNDAADNFLGALVIAGQYIIPGMSPLLVHSLLPLLSFRVCTLLWPHTLPRKSGVQGILLRTKCIRQSQFPPSCQRYDPSTISKMWILILRGSRD